ncbi:MAG: hypothetical protein IT223_09225, partial [Crocinitomicaceae bacterium]|nr:hypothetical protein [Crocinitomicaceae bacterium]
MKKKKILGLDLGTNSIGWALIEEAETSGAILGLGSRIVPMDSTMLLDFEKGKPTTKNVNRRQARGARRLLQRYKLRRNRLTAALQILGWIPEFENSRQMHHYLSESPGHPGSILTPFELYELRDRALREIVTTEELARILFHFNQRRGFLSNRKVKDAEEEKAKTEEDSEENEETAKGTVKTYEEVEIVSIEEDKSGKKIIFHITLADGRAGIAFQPIPFTQGQKTELLITKKNTKKDGQSFFFQLPKKMDWNYRKHHINSLIDESGLTLGQYYYRELKRNPHFRTKDNIILRDKYIREFEAIWDKQTELRKTSGKESELVREDAMRAIVEKLYKNNSERQNVLLKRGLKYLFQEDIIYYQRPLKSQKGSISNCRYEPKKKVIPASHPLYQEFRILDKVNNLRVYNMKDEDCTEEFMTDAVREKIIEKLNSQKSVKPSVLKSVLLPKSKHTQYYLSENDEKRPIKGNETLIDIANALEGDPCKDALLADPAKTEAIWHILYSLDKDKDVIHALTRPKNGLGISEESAKNLSKISYTSSYGSLSARAIKKLQLFMRSGSAWSEDVITKHEAIKERIEKILNGEADDLIAPRIREFISAKKITGLSEFKTLPYWAAAYLVYGSHSMSRDTTRWEKPEDIELLPKDYLRNPIVQQVVNETLQLVKDIWKQYGVMDEIRIELARELKNSAKERDSISKNQVSNRELNNSIQLKLQELGQPITNSDKYRCWLESLDLAAIDKNEIDNYLKYLKPDGKWKPAAGEITKYKLWEEQHHLSPYTGKPIPLSGLFGEQYQIDHIIPRQRFYDDSLSNKVVVEAFVNKDKGSPGRNYTAWEYISNGPATPGIKILDEERYVDLINRIFRGTKRKKLLMKEIPADFVVRQIKDTQYITKAIREELAKIVRLDNVHTTTGGITDHLREQWGIAHLFKELLLPRFEALEKKLKEKNPETRLIEKVFDNNLNKHLLKLEGYSKRLDHRHHAADALVVACTKPAHIKRLNDLNKTYQQLRENAKEAIQAGMQIKRRGGSWAFEKPWETFLEDARKELESCIVSIKNRNRLLTKGTNKHFVRNAKGEKILVQQTKGTLLSARGEMHHLQPYGETRTVEKQPLATVVKYYAQWLKEGWSEEKIKTSFMHGWQFRAIRQLFCDNTNDLKKVNAALKKAPLSVKDRPLEELS